MAIDVVSGPLTEIFNRYISDKAFPFLMKMANVCPIFKKRDSTSKENYRPISVLPSASKVFERIMLNQIYNYIIVKLFPLLCGFRKGYSTQHALLRLIEGLKRCLDKKDVAGAVLMDLSKAFDCLLYILLLAKLKSYGFSDNAMGLNGDKSKLITFESNRSNLEESKIHINGSNIVESKDVKLFWSNTRPST